MTRTTLARVASALGCGGLLVVAGAAGAAAQDPPGNNGTVKVDGVEFDLHPDNEPHVGCTFEIDFYGFDEGDLYADVTFEGIPPTPPGGPETRVLLLEDTVFIGEDAAGGGTDLDAEVAYDLTDALVGIAPHPQQGWHVRLTVHAEGSIGDDTKHKVFWVTGCETPPTTPPTSDTPPTTEPKTTTTESKSTTTVGDETTTTLPGDTTPEGPTTTVGPGGSVPPTTTPGGTLPRTGGDALPLAAGALALLGGGTAAGILARRMRAAGGEG